MRKAIRDYSKDFVATILLALVGLATLFVILSQQASALPAWFPILGENRFELKAQLETAQAVTPGQGQSVNMSGVKVGDITAVELQGGVAVVTMQVDNEYSGLIHPDASILMRPRSPLQDITIELDPGTDAEQMAEGTTIALASTKPTVNVDQILAALDGDTQAYLRLLLAGGAEALADGRDRELSEVLRRLEPTVRDLAKITGALAKRRDNLRRVITNFKKISERLAQSDVPIAEFVESSDSALGALADQEQNLRATLRGLPGTLRETRGALEASDVLTADLEPALRKLLPTATALTPALQALQPFFRKTTGPIRDQIRPFTGEVSEVVGDLRRASGPLADTADELRGAFTELNGLLNGLAFNPAGADEGYLFYLSWLSHNLNSSLGAEDSAGQLLRTLTTYDCITSQLADNTLLTRPALTAARTLTRLPTTDEVCAVS
jgi:phospholipid/cholesterol/gamma-HCH transport system substrate-binding protein